MVAITLVASLRYINVFLLIEDYTRLRGDTKRCWYLIEKYLMREWCKH